MLARNSLFMFSERSWNHYSLVPRWCHWPPALITCSPSGLTILIFLGLMLMNDGRSCAAPVPKPKNPFHLADHVEYVSDIAFSPNGKLFAVLGSRNAEGRLMVFAYPEGQLRRIMKIPYDHLTGTLSFSPNGKCIAVACYSIVQVWDVAEGRLIMHNKEAHWGRAHSLHFLQDGETLITAGRDNEVKVWNVSKGELLANFRLPPGIGGWRPNDKKPGIKPRPRPPLFVELKVPSGCLYSMVLLPDGKTVAVAIDNKQVYFWDITTGKNLRSLKPDLPTKASEIALSSDGRILATGGEGSVRLSDIEVRSKRRIVLSKNNSASTLRLRFSVDDKYLMWGGVGSKGEGAVTVWDVRSGEEHLSIEGEIDQEDILCGTLSPNGKLVAVFGGFGKLPRLRFWDLATGKELHLGKK